MNQNKPFVERRKHKRLLVKEGAFMVNAAKSGLITEISMDGMTIRYIDRKSWPEETFQADIVVDDPINGGPEFQLSNIPYRPVSECDAPRRTPDNSAVIKRRGVQFGSLSHDQLSRLQQFIDQNTVDEVFDQPIWRK